jgi:uncharacterized protein (DUF488 family)
MKLYTIGFTKKSAHDFFGILRSARVTRIVDVRLNNVSQLAGFAKQADLAYFLDRIAGIQYVHAPLLAPTRAMLDSYRKHENSWQWYEASFIDLMAERHIETTWATCLRDSDCLLCSEEKAIRCHRRLAAEYLSNYRSDIEIQHLG